MTSLKTSIKTITYLSDIGCLEIQGASLVRTRHLVGLISGVLILSVLLPVGLSIWLAHQQVETSFIEELNT